ncbi:hypothetical protein [Alteribacillus sp. HJP-4]|uniref:hypothetical protein n=1 Tax=Alteribacillus sp. HJP-4 TaxID=2775394 RepID=UPI0035CCD0A6
MVLPHVITLFTYVLFHCNFSVFYLFSTSTPMGRAAAEDPPGVDFAQLAEALPTESEGLVPCFFTMQKGASIIYDTAPNV